MLSSGLPRSNKRQQDGVVGLTSRMRLHVCEGATNNRQARFHGQSLDGIDVRCATVIAPTRIALDCLVGEDRSLASSTAWLTMFSEAISSIWSFWRAASSAIAVATSGSVSASDAVK